MACGGFLTGFLCLIGVIALFKIARHLIWRRRCGGGGCGGGGWHRSGGGGGGCGGGGAGWGGWHRHPGDSDDGYERGGPDDTFFAEGPWRGRRGMRLGVQAVAARIGATPEQRDVMTAAAESFRAAVSKQRGTLSHTRDELAAAMRDPSFDAERMGELFAQHDEALSALRKAAVGSLASVHDALDETQRDELAKLIKRAR